MFRKYVVVRSLILETRHSDVVVLHRALLGLGISDIDIPLISHFIDVYKQELYERAVENISGNLKSEDFDKLSAFVKSPFHGSVA